MHGNETYKFLVYSTAHTDFKKLTMVAEKRSGSRQQKSSKSTPKSIQPPRPPQPSIRDNNIDDEDDNDEEVIDYAATADEFFANGDDDDNEEVEDGDEEDDDEEEENENEIDDDEVDENVQDQGQENDKEGSDADDDDEEEEDDEAEDDDEPDEKDDDEDDDEDDDSVEDEEEEDLDEAEAEADAIENARQQQKLANAGNKMVIPGTEEPCTFDLRNLLAMSSYPIDSTQLYNKKSNSTKASTTDLQSKHVIVPQTTLVNEDYLLQKSLEGCNQLIAALWQLPVERSDAGPMVILPSFDESKIPRKLPPPAPKAETKWEKFAKAKGIGQNKDKRSAKVWDESVGDWQYRHGFKKAGNDGKEWPIMEVKPGDDPMSDPWEKQRDAKRKRVDKNVEQNMRNEERAGNLSKGTSTRVLKSITAGRKAGREGGRLDLPVGVPVDLKSSGRKGNSDVALANTTVQRLQRGKASTTAALLATQVSTASLGKFDKIREGEPERNKAISRSVVKKRKFESTTDKNVIATEAERSMKVLKSLSSGGVEKEKDRKKGRLATGETAYDYDYDDGLGASTFRKKKGRAGAGKMKKMTKKRTK